jgi:alpha-tubulin suppressor-like RCC1 family protein
VVDVACGDFHSCVLTNIKDLYMWGSNKEGQLGLDIENYTIVHKPMKIIQSEYMNTAK